MDIELKAFGETHKLKANIGKYPDGTYRIDATTEDGMPWSHMSIHYSAMRMGVPLEKCVYVKDYSEGIGSVDALISGGVIEPNPVLTIRSGFVEISAYRLTEKAMEEADNVH